jgi:N12 class adenine-specific DNA methylase
LRSATALGRGAAGVLTALVLVLAVEAGAQPPKPGYLPYAEFAAADPAQAVGLKRAYNEAIQRYNQSIYDYHVTLEKHDLLVDAHNRSTDTAERKKTREEAETLRARLTALRRDVTTRAAAVDEAARRAVAAGVTLPR